jgi:hypothetical protein
MQSDFHACRYQNSEQADNIPVCNACSKSLAESLADPVGLTKELAGVDTGDDGYLSTASVRSSTVVPRYSRLEFKSDFGYSWGFCADKRTLRE